MKYLFSLVCIVSFLFVGCSDNSGVKISKSVLKDKIKGGWAGQTIGVSFGGPTEFKFMGIMIPDSVNIPWADTTCAWWYSNFPGLFDDLYMDLTFVDVYEKYGLDAPVDSFASAFAHAGYELWHANQAARYNILQGIMPPKSGDWKNNPHADCIDFQIESDFAGLMSPGMPNVASDISDKIGHIMNYGDGWYGGVFVSNMYAQAFVSSDINHIVTEALKAVPEQSDFYKCISDVISLHKKYPDDWTKTWYEIQKKWADEVGCPDGVQKDLDIDAKINAAYIAMGLLYGNGDFEKTIIISTRCGQDSDCNPSNAAGILGVVLGYSKIPDKWKNAVKPVEDKDFSYTTISLNDVYEMGYNHAIKNIVKNGGKVEGDEVIIKSEPAKPVRYEKAFDGIYPVKREKINYNEAAKEWTLNFEGTGFVISGGVFGDNKKAQDYVAQLEVYIDGSKTETVSLPLNSSSRRTEICWNYNLPNKQHEVKFKVLNPSDAAKAGLVEAVIYTDKE